MHYFVITRTEKEKERIYLLRCTAYIFGHTIQESDHTHT